VWFIQANRFVVGAMQNTNLEENWELTRCLLQFHTSVNIQLSLGDFKSSWRLMTVYDYRTFHSSDSQNRLL
jgi:hypothetical protein